MRYIKKSFLSNSYGESGVIISSIESPKDIKNIESGNNYRYNHNYSTIDIRDCNRSITLDFTYHTQSNYKKRLVKIDKLMKELQLFKESFIKANDNMLELIAKHKELELVKLKNQKKGK